MTKRIYLFSGGGFVIASSSDEFLDKMRKSSLFGHTDSATEFMINVSNRCLLQNGSKISTQTPDWFLQDLISAEFVTAIPVNY
jgi:hypothetical protein